MTVLGPINPDDLGTTLMHEHVFVDIRCWLVPPHAPEEMAVPDQPITRANLGLFHREPLILYGDLVLNYSDILIEETLAFKRSGGGTFVEVSQIGIGRDPLRLQQLARATGLNMSVAVVTTWPLPIRRMRACGRRKRFQPR